MREDDYLLFRREALFEDISFEEFKEFSLEDF